MGRSFHEISWKWVSTPAPHLSISPLKRRELHTHAPNGDRGTELRLFCVIWKPLRYLGKVTTGKLLLSVLCSIDYLIPLFSHNHSVKHELFVTFLFINLAFTASERCTSFIFHTHLCIYIAEAFKSQYTYTYTKTEFWYAYRYVRGKRNHYIHIYIYKLKVVNSHKAVMQTNHEKRVIFPFEYFPTKLHLFIFTCIYRHIHK